MKLVLDLITGRSITPKELEINELVDVFSMLGCVGNIIKQPTKSSECILPDNGNILRHDTTDIEDTELDIATDRATGSDVLVHQLETDRSIDSVLQQMQQLQERSMKRME